MKTETEYFAEVKSTASYIVDLAIENLELDGSGAAIDWEAVQDLINDSLLHEQIDSHEYAIYYRHHLPILQFSDNAEYGIDHGLIDVASEVAGGGLQALHSALAFWAFCTDVEQAIQDLISQRDFS